MLNLVNDPAPKASITAWAEAKQVEKELKKKQKGGNKRRGKESKSKKKSSCLPW